MIDTVNVGFRLSLTSRQLRAWNQRRLITVDGKVWWKYFQMMEIADGASAEFIYYPPNHKFAESRFLAQVSIPKLLYGNNVEMVLTEAEIESAIQKANASIAEKWWLPKVDLGQGVLKRIDAAYNHPVGDQVSDYIAYLSRLPYPGRKTSRYQPAGVVYQSSPNREALRTSFYDKWKESHLPIAHGMLRQESIVKRSDYIKRMMGLENPTLRDVKIAWLERVLQRDLELLGLTGRVICERSRIQQMLMDKYGYNRAMQLYGHLMTKKEMSPEKIALWKPNRRTIQRWEKQIADAGIAPMMTDNGVVLPPLSIDVWTAKSDGDW